MSQSIFIFNPFIKEPYFTNFMTKCRYFDLIPIPKIKLNHKIELINKLFSYYQLLSLVTDQLVTKNKTGFNTYSLEIYKIDACRWSS